MRNMPIKRTRFLPVMVIALCLPLLLLFFSSLLGDRTSQESLRLLEESIHRAAVECYALEGYYPPTLDYLKKRYGVSVDNDRYFVDYRFVASNLVPDITVLPISAQP